MTIDTVLNILGLAISVGSLVAAGLKRQAVLAIFAVALILTTATGLWLEFRHRTEIDNIENVIKAKLSKNRWTFDRIYSEIHYVPYEVVHEALFRAVDNQRISDTPLECTVNDGSILSTRVYYILPDSN